MLRFSTGAAIFNGNRDKADSIVAKKILAMVYGSLQGSHIRSGSSGSGYCFFNLEVPTELEGVDTNILDPKNTYKNLAEWEEKAKDLAQHFIKNFDKYTKNNEAGKALVAAGPQL